MTELSSESSEVASRLVDLLSDAGIDARQRVYAFYRTGLGARGAGSAMEPRLAVLVHQRDRIRATEIATELEHDLVREQQEEQRRPLVSEKELTEEEMEAGPLAERHG